MTESVKINIIIPTCDRADTLIHCLRTVVHQNYANLRVIVSDNYSSDDTRAVVHGFFDKRVEYFNTGQRVGMSANWEFGLSKVTDGWVMFIGDDDGLMPDALLNVDQAIKLTGVAAFFSRPSSFIWPNHFESIPQGILTIPWPSNKAHTVHDSKIELSKVLNGESTRIELPWLYGGGGASIDLINRLRGADGNFFQSRIPDVYSAVALSLGTKSYAIIERPIVINGSSRHSNGASSLLGQQNSVNTPASKFLAESNIPFHDTLVFGNSYQVIVYESYLRAAHLYEYLSFDLRDQLKIALINAPPHLRTEIVSDCSKMLSINGLQPISETYVACKRLSNYLYRLIPTLIDRKTIKIYPTKIRVVDVFNASLAAGSIYMWLESCFKQSKLSKVLVVITLYTLDVIRAFNRKLEVYRNREQRSTSNSRT